MPMPRIEISLPRAAVLALLVPISASASAAAAADQRCLAPLYTLPDNIAEETRPYLVCGMFNGDGHFTTRLNGMPTSTRGSLEGCRTIRATALAAAEGRLSRTMRDPSARRAFLQTEFERADHFLEVVARSEDRTVGETPSTPQCRNTNASN